MSALSLVLFLITGAKADDLATLKAASDKALVAKLADLESGPATKAIMKACDATVDSYTRAKASKLEAEVALAKLPKEITDDATIKYKAALEKKKADAEAEITASLAAARTAGVAMNDRRWEIRDATCDLAHIQGKECRIGPEPGEGRFWSHAYLRLQVGFGRNSLTSAEPTPEQQAAMRYIGLPEDFGGNDGCYPRDWFTYRSARR